MRIHTAGRLGNQLFSWAFAHYLAGNTQKVQLITEYPLLGSNSFISECDHVVTKQIHFALRLKIKFFFKFYYKFPKRRELISKIFRASTEPELYNLNSAQDYFGFFQKFNYVDEVSETIVNELRLFLKLVDLPKPFVIWSDEGPYQCFHIRRGDYLLPENSGYGLLDLDWYLTNSDQTLPTVVVTDDKTTSQDLIDAIGECLVLGPDEADPVQALAIMANSNHLVAANSTLSWWGGFMVAKRGYSVVYPFTETEAHRDINSPLFIVRDGTFEPRNTTIP